MGASRTSFEKLQRDRAKKAKADVKRAKRQGKVLPGEEQRQAPAPSTLSDSPLAVLDTDRQISAEELMRLVELVNRMFENEEIDEEEFEERKMQLFERVSS